MNQDREIDAVYLLKHGRRQEIQEYFKGKQKGTYPADFPAYMDQMLREHRMKRKTLARRSGLSEQYLYKLLRGDKKTKERDFILAICLGLGLTLAQTQHALRIYGMPILSKEDARSHIIILAIEEGQDIDVLDEWLEKAGHPLIRTSAEMPSAPITMSGIQADVPETVPEAPAHTYTEVSRKVEAMHCGQAPMDYAYIGTMLVRDETGRAYELIASYAPFGDVFLVRDPEETEQPEEGICPMDAGEDIPEPLEEYESLAEAGASPFLSFFLDLDRETDEKVLEVMGKVDDTRNYGVRFGAGFARGILRCYLEAFNNKEPARREYYQILQTEEGYTYTVSHESYFMRIELGDIYPAYFGEKREPEYFIKVHDTRDLAGENMRIRFIFDELRLILHQRMREAGIEILRGTESEYLEEKLTTLSQQAVMAFHRGDMETSASLNLEMLELLDRAETEAEDDPARRDHLDITRIVTLSKQAICCERMGKGEEALDWYRKIHTFRDRVFALKDREDLQTDGAVSALAGACNELAMERMGQGLLDQAAPFLQDAITLMEGRCETQWDWSSLFQACLNYAYVLDAEDPELSVTYTEKAIEIARDHYLDQLPSAQMAIVTAYSNHAWVLWNCLGSEEAAIYYGRAIEMLEGYLRQKKQDPDEVRQRLAHIGGRLLRLYEDIGRKKEMDRLRTRLSAYGVVPEEEEN